MSELHMLTNDMNEVFAELNNSSFQYWEKIPSATVCVHMGVADFKDSKRTQTLIYGA